MCDCKGMQNSFIIQAQSNSYDLFVNRSSGLSHLNVLADGIVNFCSATGVIPLVYFHKTGTWNKKLAEIVFQNLPTSLDTDKMTPTYRRARLVIVDRNVDLLSPLSTEYTVENVLRSEFGASELNSGDVQMKKDGLTFSIGKSIWCKIRHREPDVLIGKLLEYLLKLQQSPEGSQRTCRIQFLKEFIDDLRLFSYQYKEKKKFEMRARQGNSEVWRNTEYTRKEKLAVTMHRILWRYMSAHTRHETYRFGTEDDSTMCFPRGILGSDEIIDRPVDFIKKLEYLALKK